ncbi:MAG: hypothetical protein AAGF97_03685 [Planctomycetota bacterium]
MRNLNIDNVDRAMDLVQISVDVNRMDSSSSTRFRLEAEHLMRRLYWLCASKMREAYAGWSPGTTGDGTPTTGQPAGQPRLARAAAFRGLAAIG